MDSSLIWPSFEARFLWRLYRRKACGTEVKLRIFTGLWKARGGSAQVIATRIMP